MKKQKHIQTFESYVNSTHYGYSLQAADEIKSVKESNRGRMNEDSFQYGPKTKKFQSKIEEWDWFTDADEGGEDTLPKEYHAALKTLNIKADDAIVCFFDSVGSAEDVLDAAKFAGLKYVEVDGDDEDDPGSGGIVFSSKQ